MLTPNPVEDVLSMPEEERRAWLRSLAPDDTADLIPRASLKERTSLVESLDPWPGAEVPALLAFQEDSAAAVSTRLARRRPLWPQ